MIGVEEMMELARWRQYGMHAVIYHPLRNQRRRHGTRLYHTHTISPECAIVTRRTVGAAAQEPHLIGQGDDCSCKLR